MLSLKVCLVYCLLFINAAWTAYVNPTTSAYCVAGCSEALTPFAFAGVSGTVEDAYSPWESNLRLDSIYLCSSIYCSEKDTAAGINYLVASCEVESGSGCIDIRTNYYSKFVDVSQSTLDGLQRFELTQSAVAPVFNTTVVPDQNAFKAGFWTIARFYNNVYINQKYSYALYGYWAGVLLIGMTIRLLKVLRTYSRDVKSASTDAGLAIEVGVRNLTATERVSRLLDRYLLLPATWPTACRQPVGWCTLPTRLESLTIFAFIIINVVLCATNYFLSEGNLFYPDKNMQFLRYFSDRNGVLAIANLPIIWLFSTRNNLFIWLTGWNFATYNSFHRWVARVATLEAVIHACGYTAFEYIDGGSFANYAANWQDQYWYCGAMAMISMGLLLAFSVQPLRKHYYEFFLLMHIALAVICLAAIFYHIDIFEGEYNGYFWPCVTFWVAERFIRIARLVFLNVKVKISGQKALVGFNEKSNLVRIDVPVWLASEPKTGTYYYLYTPSSWPGWESHPFTLSHWEYIGTSRRGSRTSQISETCSQTDIEFEKTVDITSYSLPHTDSENGEVAKPVPGRSGLYQLSFMIRAYKGYTARLRDSAMRKCRDDSNSIELDIFAEGPYGAGHSSRLERFNQVILIMGGSGIAVGISYLRQLFSHNITDQKIRLVWSVRERHFGESVLHNELRKLMAEPARNANVSIDLHITQSQEEAATEGKAVESPQKDSAKQIATFHLERPDIPSIIDEEVKKGNGPLAVMVSGPAQMADDARSSVVRTLRVCEREIKYFEEVFGW